MTERVKNRTTNTTKLPTRPETIRLFNRFGAYLPATERHVVYLWAIEGYDELAVRILVDPQQARGRADRALARARTLLQGMQLYVDGVAERAEGDNEA